MAASMCARRLVNKTLFLSKLFRRDNVLPTQLQNWSHRYFSVTKVTFTTRTDLPKEDLKKQMELLSDKFSEARELLDDARESQGTVYFSDDLAEAAAAVEETLKEYRELQNRVSETQRQELISTLGLRMEELKAQQSAIEDSLKD